MARLIIISNRLPFSLDKNGDKVSLRQSSGGLVSAIKSYFENSAVQRGDITEKMWMGVADFPQEDWDQLVGQHAEEQDFSLLPVFVDKDLYDNYYNGFSNSVIWPLFHYFSSLADFGSQYFEAYIQVNQLFAEKILPMLRPDDVIWIHDYQLMILPHLLRSKRPEATIGFFLHIPFPSYEIFRLLPTEWKKTLLHGLMGADLIGFHTYDYVQHFLHSVRMLMGVENHFHNLQYMDRFIRVDLFPIGIDYNKFHSTADDPEVEEHRKLIRANLEDKKIIFSVDRLDYTKGLMQRLNGFEHFLERYPEWKEKMVFILNIVPSRDTIPAYNERKKQIEEKVGTINGRFSSISWQPVIYRYNHLPFKEMIALYQAADVALITPLRDGMNLVAKEYVAASMGRGVLILSELAGAASELSEAILVNPTDVSDVASSITRALAMPLYEQRNRISLMQRRLQEYDVTKWVNDFLDQLAQVKLEQRKQAVKLLDDKAISGIHRHYQRAKNRCLLLDYDGTLVPFTRIPSEASPDNAVKDLLARLSSDNHNHVVVISGRDVSSLERWLGGLPISLVAEHGASFKMRDGGSWQQVVSVSDLWKEEIRRIMQLFVLRCAGSFIEEKSNTIAWHYRNTQTGLGFTRSRELLNTLSQLTQNTTLQVIDGNKVVEVRIAGFDKGATALKIIGEMDPDFVLCIGDDTTDEDMFKALDGEAYTIKVNNGATAAQYTILSQQQVLPLLNIITSETPQVHPEKEYAGS